jgi:hypothetical protein
MTIEKLSKSVCKVLSSSHQAIKKLSQSHLGSKRPETQDWKPSLESLDSRIVPSAAVPDVDLSTAGSSGAINGAVFEQLTLHVGGNGKFQPFVRIQGHQSTVEQGYNTDARPLQFDEKTDATFTHSIRLSDLAEVSNGNTHFRVFALKTNEPGNSELLSLDEVQVFLGSSGNLTGYDPATGTLAGNAPVYDLDAGGNHWVQLNDALGHGNSTTNMLMYIPSNVFAGAGGNPYVYLYSRFGEHLPGNGGFESWGTAEGVPAPPVIAGTSPASISGYAYIDVNRNGTKDAGDAALAGVTVTLTGTDVNGNAINLTATTDANGFYIFTNLAAGNYQLTRTAPAGFDNAGTDVGTVGGSTDGVGSADGNSIGQIVLKAGDNGVNYDFAEAVIPLG